MTKPTANPTYRDRIAVMAACPTGVSVRDLCAALGIAMDAATAHLATMVYQGRLHRARRPGVKLRWFAAVADRDAWVAAPPIGAGPNTTAAPKLVPAKAKLKSRAKQPGPQFVRALPATRAPVTIKPTSGHKGPASMHASFAGVQRGPAPDPYRSIRADMAAPGAGAGFAAAGIGRYIEPAASCAAMAAA